MKVLITGSPGVGKTTVGRILEQKGYGYIDIDENKDLKYWEEKESGKRIEFEGKKDLEWYDKHDVNLDVGALKELLSKRDGEVIFVGGVMSNIVNTLDFFDKVFLLRTDLKTLRERRLERRDVKSRAGVSKAEIEQGFEEHEVFQSEMLKRGAIPIDTTGDPEEDVSKILNMVH